MNKCIITVVLLSFINLTIAQTTFVEDVEKVESIVISYKVDSIGKRYDLKIDEELTSFKNESWQQGCLEHFKNGKLKYPLRMLNEEWRAVYYFVNPKYKTSSLNEVDRKKCNRFKRGEYKYVSAAYNQTRILRRRTRQIEKGGYKDQRQVYRINWTEDHKYVLTTLKLPLAKDKEKIGRRIEVEIIEILDDNSYLYRSTAENTDHIVLGVIKKVD